VAVRKKAADRVWVRVRVRHQVRPVDDSEAFADAGPDAAAQEAAIRAEQALAREAFAALPERWQLVLWHHDVEGESLRLVAERLGIGVGAASALASRAREGMREQYLAAHLSADAPDPDQHPSQRTLTRHARNKLRQRQQQKVDEHLEDCARCRLLLLEARTLASSMRLVVAPAMLGVGVAAYATDGLPGAGASTFAAGPSDGSRSSGSGNAATSSAESSTGPALRVAIAVACVAALAFIVVLAMAGGDGDSPPAASSTARSGAPAVVPGAPTPAVTQPAVPTSTEGELAVAVASPTTATTQPASPSATSAPPPGTVAIDVSLRLKSDLRPGREALARVRVRNTSGVSVTDAVVSVTLPPGVSAVRVTSRWTVTPQGVSATLGSLGAGGGDVLPLRLRVAADAPAPVPSPAVWATSQPSG